MIDIKFPKHDFGLILEHNPNKLSFSTVDQHIKQYNLDFISEEDKTLSIKNDDLWVLTWYPENSVGHFIIAASSLEKLLYFAGTE